MMNTTDNTPHARNEPVSAEGDMERDENASANFFRFEATEIDASIRLDKWLTTQLETQGESGYSRSRIKQLIQNGCLNQGQKTLLDPSSSVKSGTIYHLEIPHIQQAEPQAENIPLDILFEDEHLIVLNKPTGMVVHPAPGNPSGTLVNALLHHCGSSLTGIGGVMRPGIVHRLDKDTSGVMVAAKTQPAHIGLSELFAQHDLDRRYTALVWGLLTESNGQIDAPIGRHKTDRKKQAISPQGKEAQTDYQLLRHLPPYASLVECQLHTGRTHQIRVHLTSIGHSLIGDPVYGRPMRLAQMPDQPSRELLQQLRQFPHQALCATQLGFTHPITGEYIDIKIDISDEIQKLVRLIETTISKRGQA